MGGSGTGGYKPSQPRSSCADLVFQATVNSPKPSVVSALVPGEELAVATAPSGAAVHVSRKRTLVGSLTGTKVASLINCIASGYEYKAIVVSVSGGQCVVRVESA
jgi:hypothetical protein